MCKPISRAYFEAFMFIKKNKEKKTTFGSDLSFSFRGTAYTRKVLLYLALSAVFILFFRLCTAQISLKMRAETGSSACFSKGSFWEFGSVLDKTILFPSEIRWCFSPRLAMTLRFVTHFLVRTREHSPKTKRKLGRKMADYICTVPPSAQNNSDHSPARLPQCRPHLNKKRPRCSVIVMQPTVCCLFTWTLDRGSPGSATIFTLEQTGPGSNQAISTACCHSLSSSFHNGHIRFLFQRH